MCVLSISANGELREYARQELQHAAIEDGNLVIHFDASQLAATLATPVEVAFSLVSRLSRTYASDGQALRK